MSETTSAASRAASWWKVRVPLDIEKSEACLCGNKLAETYQLLGTKELMHAWMAHVIFSKHISSCYFLYLRLKSFSNWQPLRKGQHLHPTNWIPIGSGTKIFDVFSIGSLVILIWLHGFATCSLHRRPALFLNHCSSTVTVPEFPQWTRGNGSSKYCASDLCSGLRLLMEGVAPQTVEH